jgi:hypothetical protein
VTFGQLQDEVSGVSDEAPAGLEQPLKETLGCEDSIPRPYVLTNQSASRRAG